MQACPRAAVWAVARFEASRRGKKQRVEAQLHGAGGGGHLLSDRLAPLPSMGVPAPGAAGRRMDWIGMPDEVHVRIGVVIATQESRAPRNVCMYNPGCQPAP